MALNTKTINRRIKSIVSTRKITKAMELVAASKMRKAVAAVLASRPYAAMAWETVDRLARKTAFGGHGTERGDEDYRHPLLTPRPVVRKSLAVLVTSDRGLCGGFNAQVLKAAAEFLRHRPAETVAFVTAGKRGEAFVRRRGLPLVASFGSLLAQPTAANVRPLARLLTDAFIKGACDEVVLIYTDFVSAIVQKPRSKTLLPLKKDAELGQAEAPVGTVVRMPDEKGAAPPEMLFEPDPATVLDRLLPRIAETQLYQALLESLASEHSARMLAMRNATDSASEMLDDLRFTFNQARQAGITQEIAEIAAGAAALES